MSKTGVRIVKGVGSLIPKAPVDHPIYKLGYAVGVIRSTDLLKAAPD